MTKKIAIVLLAVLIAVSTGFAQIKRKPAPQAPPPPPPPAAKVKLPGTMIFGRYEIFSPSDENFKSVYGDGTVYGAEVRIRTVGNLYFSLGGGYLNQTGKLTLTEENTTMTIYPVEAMLVFHVVSWYVSPYVGAGGAVCKYKETNVIGTVDAWGFGYVLCGGVTAHYKAFAVDARVKYSSVKVKPFEEQADIGGLTISFGLGFAF